MSVMKLNVFVLLICVNTSVVWADYLDEVGQSPYEQCGYCHEIDGNPRMPLYPRLAGQHPAYLIKQLQEFRSGKRTGQMQATAELLSDTDILAVAEYFSQQSVVFPKLEAQSNDEQQIAMQIYQQGDPARGLLACSNCHGMDGLGKSDVPRLSAQHADYLHDQLMLFKSGQRKNDAGGQMRAMATLLSEREITALTGFLARLPVKFSGASE